MFLILSLDFFRSFLSIVLATISTNFSFVKIYSPVGLESNFILFFSMSLRCSKCSGTLGGSDVIYATVCGHCFHQKCLAGCHKCPFCGDATSRFTWLELFPCFDSDEASTRSLGNFKIVPKSIKKSKKADISMKSPETLKPTKTKPKNEQIKAKKIFISKFKEITRKKKNSSTGIKVLEDALLTNHGDSEFFQKFQQKTAQENI